MTTRVLRSLPTGSTRMQDEWPRLPAEQATLLNEREVRQREAEAFLEQLQHQEGSQAIDKAWPQSVTFESFYDPRLRLTRPISVTIEEELGQFIAYAAELEEFGYGDDPFEAVDDLRKAVADLYWALEERSDRLGPELARIWGVLQAMVVKAA